ncbi:MAG TPA: SDR family NAD(P)-dependent oxidoreductase [Saprospiraceae bacterium]|nr:SDR family NAD(P)-dependent oxidoreductase [Saprospiraceae bacterium]
MKTALITGASGNLGVAVVKTLFKHGFGICATVGSGGIPDMFKTMTQDARQVNLTDEAEVKEYINTITQQWPDLRAAVLLVGGFATGGFRETDGAAIDKQIALNFKTAYFVARPLLEYFEQHGGGQFILIGARPALQADAGKDFVAYALSKSLVLHLARLISTFGKGKNISATVFVPSTIDTEANRKAMPEADFSRWVKAEDIAETIAFVLSDPGQSLRDTVIKVYNEA